MSPRPRRNPNQPPQLTEQHVAMLAQKDKEIAELTEQSKRLQAIASASEVDATAVSGRARGRARAAAATHALGGCCSCCFCFFPHPTLLSRWICSERSTTLNWSWRRSSFSWLRRIASCRHVISRPLLSSLPVRAAPLNDSSPCNTAFRRARDRGSRRRQPRPAKSRAAASAASTCRAGSSARRASTLVPASGARQAEHAIHTRTLDVF